MKNKVMAILGVATLALAFAFVAQPTGFVPLFDADLNRLSMTQREAQCAAEGFMASNSEEGAAECRETNALPTDIDLEGVTPRFCTHISSVISTLSYEDCLRIMYDMEYWPTYNGEITNAWNRSAPYPLSVLFSDSGDQRDTGRTGEREENLRGEE